MALKGDSVMSKRQRPQWSRRDALKGVGASAILATACKGDGDDGPNVVLEDFDLLRERIDTVVVLMMENRSFDHYLGALSLLEGRTDIDGLTPEISNPHPDGSAVLPAQAQIDCLEDPPHSWTSSHAQFNDGANDGFVTEFYSREPDHVEEVMAYFTREDLPTLYTLVDEYTVCDRWFSSLMTSTQPNRFYFHCGQNNGVTNNDVPIGQTYPSVYTNMDNAGHSWGCYYANVPGVVLLPDRFVGEHQLRYIDKFFEDASAGELPNLVFIEPAFGRNDDHPPAHPTAGQLFIAQIYEALANSPQWDRIAFFITYDEHGGFHDHVPPPTAPDAHADVGFDQLGFRVPGLVVGPWAMKGHVSHDVYDHTSMLAFVEHLFQLEPLSSRSAAADPMRECFDWEALAANTPSPPAMLDPIEADEEVIYSAECVTDGNDLARMDHCLAGTARYVKHFHAGTKVDRLDDSDETVARLLERAKADGLFIQKDS